MYKVFIENTPILIQKETESSEILKEFMPVLEKEKLNDLKQALESHHDEQVSISAEQGEMFFSQLEKIDAAGGIVYHTALEKYLFIHRHGKWDLPKGKIDQGETAEKAAVREIREECGITGLKKIKPIANTYHCYQMYNDTWIKKTYWFYFEYDKNELLAPQLEEGITTARWFSKDEFHRILANTYGNISDIVELFK
jgi:8-oxo-dGTP pyrophosphatase MutT (NUDIX family)